MQENAEDIVIISDDQVFSRSNKEEPESRLHGDLQADLEKLGIQNEKVSVSRNISSFIERYVKPVLTKFWKQGWTTGGTFMEGFEPERILGGLKETLIGILHTSLLNLLEINSTNTYVYKIDILRWPENAEIVEAFKIEEKKLLLVTKAFVVFDAEVITTEGPIPFISLMGKKILTFGGTNWNESTKDYRINFRVGGNVQLSILWDFENSRVETVNIKKFDFV